MEGIGLYEKIEEAIAQSRMRYEADKEDSYLSVIRAEELKTLQYLCERVRSGESVDELLEEMKRKLPELEEQRKDELERPSFDWYDEHYHFKLLDGQCDAYKIMVELLESGAQNSL